nr:alkane hydroxylase MAH1-like [Coffea arabica]
MSPRIPSAWFGNRDMILTADLANVQHLLSTNLSNYPKGPDTRRIFSAYGQILFAADIKDWRFHRKFALAFFHNQKLQHFTVRINQEVLEKGLVPVLDHASEHRVTVDLQDVFQRAMLDATFMMISGKNRGSLCVGLPKDVVLEALHDASDVILLRHILPERFWMFQRWLGVGAEKRLSKACEVLDDAAAKCIKIWKEQTSNISKSEHGEESLDAITFFYNEEEFLESVGEQDYTMREIVKGIIFAGTDTASPVLSWVFWLLSKNPIVESKIREELAVNLRATESRTRIFFDLKELKKLVYLHAAMCETLRLFPSSPFQSRTCIKADLLPSGHHVKANKRVVICTNAMARMRFVAFSSGPRICPGKELAFARLKAIAATSLFNYQFHVGTKIAKDQPVATPATSIILRMKHVFSKYGCSGVGVVVRDEWGNFVASSSHKIFGIFSPEVIEAYAAKTAISLLLQWKEPKIILEGDSLKIINMIKLMESDDSTYRVLLDYILLSLQSFAAWEANWVPRQANVPVHLLVRNARSISNICSWSSSPPPFLSSAILADLSSP